MVFLKLSIKYWKKHRKRLSTLATVIVLGAVALCCVALFVRSNKSFVLNNELDMLGNYDAIFYELEQGDIDLISKNEDVLTTGYYKELGYAGTTKDSAYKVISFPDEESRQLYHMSCSKGKYPERKDEIAIDIDTAKKLGVAPETGQQIELTFYSLDKQEIYTNEFTISGVFKATAKDVFGGAYRYPNSMEEYDVPVICVSDSLSTEFGDSLVTAFIQTDGEKMSLANEISQSDFTQLAGWDVPSGRTYAYSYVLGIADHLTSEYGELSLNSLLQAMQEGNVWKDFYSSVIIPLFGILLFIIIVISVFSLVRTLLLERSKEIAVLRSIGMTQKQTFFYLFFELMMLISVFIGIGLLLGTGTHYILINAINTVCETHIPLGIHTNSYVEAVTISPWIYTILVLETSAALAIIFPLLTMVRIMPIEVFEKRFVKKNKRNKHHFTQFDKCSWKRLINEHIQFNDIFVLIITCVVMSTCFLGYNYFKALSELNNAEYKYSLKECGLEDWDYTASKTELSDMYEFLIENHHDYGIDEETYLKFADNPSIEQSFARIVNHSTRISYKEEDTEKLPDYLKVRTNKKSKDSFENALYEAENAMIEGIGYSSKEDIYSLPSIGITQKEFEPLSSFVIDGTINLEKIQNGQEVVLVIPSQMKEDVLEQFHAGDSLPLSDIVLSQEEDSYNFGHFIPSDYATPVYSKEVKEPESGQMVDLTSYAFGKRQNITTKIGAIVVLDDQKLLEKYSIPYTSVLSGEIPEVEEDDEDDEESVFYTMCLLGTSDTFASWQLPDVLYTEVDFALKEHADVSAVNDEWYQIIEECNGISFQSSYEILEKMQLNSKDTMIICYIMLIMLIFIGVVAIGIKLYSRIKMKAKTIARLRALGMPVSWLEKMVIRQNILYPIIGAIVSIIPVSICQMFFLYLKKQIDSGAWDSMMETGTVSWWHNIPFRYDLFSYHPIEMLLLLVVCIMILILIATIPQVLFIRKQSIAETIDTDNF